MDIPVWELLVSILLTALVTYLTIRWSVRAATRETQRTIDANLKAEQRAKETREREASEAMRTARSRERVALAGALSRGLHEIEPLVGAEKSDPHKIAALAQWRSMRTTFATSEVENALDLYEYADLRLDQAQNGGPRPKDPIAFVTYLVQKQFAEDLSKLATEWAQTGDLPGSVVNETPLLLKAQQERRHKFLREAVKALNIDIPDADIDLPDSGANR